MSLIQNADQRWAAAQSIAAGVMDDGMPKRRLKVWLWLAALAVGGALGGLLLGMLLADIPSGSPASSDSADDNLAVRLILASVVQGIGLVIGVVGFIWALRTGRYITRWRAVASPLNLSERKWVTTHIRTRTDVDDPGKKSVVLAIARQNRASALGLLPVLICMLSVALATMLVGISAVIVWLEGVVVLGFIGVFGLLARDYRRAGRYLDTFGGHPRAGGSADSSGGTAG